MLPVLCTVTVTLKSSDVLIADFERVRSVLSHTSEKRMVCNVESWGHHALVKRGITEPMSETPYRYRSVQDVLNKIIQISYQCKYCYRNTHLVPEDQSTIRQNFTRVYWPSALDIVVEDGSSPDILRE